MKNSAIQLIVRLFLSETLNKMMKYTLSRGLHAIAKWQLGTDAFNGTTNTTTAHFILYTDCKISTLNLYTIRMISFKRKKKTICIFFDLQVQILYLFYNFGREYQWKKIW